MKIIEMADDQRSPILKYLLTGELPINLAKARMLKGRAALFVIIDNILYKHAFSMPLLRCLGLHEVQQTLHDVHEGDCSEHLGGRLLAAKIMRACFFWPTLHKDASMKVSTNDKSQRHEPLSSSPVMEFKKIFNPFPSHNEGQTYLFLSLLLQGIKSSYSLPSISSPSGWRMNH